MVAKTHHDGPSATARMSESGKSLVKIVVEFSEESQIFRVDRKAHPEIELIAIKTSDDV